MTRVLAYLVIGIIFIPGITLAKDTSRIGLAANAANLGVKDPDGQTGTTSVTYLSGIMTQPINRNNPSLRWWHEIKYRSFELTPSTTEIGQDVTSLSLSTTAQKAWPSSSPSIGAYWVGLGAEINMDDYKNRLTVDKDGFLDKTYPDRSEVILGTIFNAGFNFTKTQGGYFVGINANYHIPIDNGIEGFSANAFLMW